MIVLDKADHHFNGTLARARHTDIVLEVMARAAADTGPVASKHEPAQGRSRAAA
jgi:hypothetical protein